MSQHEEALWTDGITNAPLPLLIDPQESNINADFYLRYYQEVGPVYCLSRKDKKPLTILAGQQANAFTAHLGERYFVSGRIWHDFNAAMGKIRGGMTAIRDGEANHKRRAQSSHYYSRATIMPHLSRMVDITRTYASWQPGETIELLPTMQRIVAEQLGQLLVNQSIGEYLPDFVLYLEVLISNSFTGNRAAFSTPQFLQARERVYELGRIILERHRFEPVQQREPDLVDGMLEQVVAHPGSVSEEELERVGVGPLLAGLKTVAETNSFLLHELLKHPDVLQRIVAEADHALVGELLTWDTLKSMSATLGAAMEALRLSTGGTGFQAVVVQPFTFAGYQLEVGDEVFVARTVTHFLPEFFPYPETFDIDRYHEPRNEHRQHNVYTPFGLGEHTCLGSGIAEIQLMVITATLLHEYQLDLDPSDAQFSLYPRVLVKMLRNKM